MLLLAGEVKDLCVLQPHLFVRIPLTRGIRNPPNLNAKKLKINANRSLNAIPTVNQVTGRALLSAHTFDNWIWRRNHSQSDSIR